MRVKDKLRFDVIWDILASNKILYIGLPPVYTKALLYKLLRRPKRRLCLSCLGLYDLAEHDLAHMVVLKQAEGQMGMDIISKWRPRSWW